MGTVTIFQTYQIGIVVSNVGSQSKLVMTCPQAIFGEINAQNSVGKSHRSLDVLTDFRVKVHIMAGHPCVGIDPKTVSFLLTLITERGLVSVGVLILKRLSLALSGDTLVTNPESMLALAMPAAKTRVVNMRVLFMGCTLVN